MGKDERMTVSARAVEDEALPAGSRRREVGTASARSLLLTVLGEFVHPRGTPVWTATLVAALAELGIEEKSARQAIARPGTAAGWSCRSQFPKPSVSFGTSCAHASPGWGWVHPAPASGSCPTSTRSPTWQR